MVTQGAQPEQPGLPPEEWPDTPRGRTCPTPECTGRPLVLWRTNCIDHVTRRLECDFCELRMTSTERILANSFTADDLQRAIDTAARKLASLRETQAVEKQAGPAVRPCQLELFDSLE